MIYKKNEDIMRKKRINPAFLCKIRLFTHFCSCIIDFVKFRFIMLNMKIAVDQLKVHSATRLHIMMNINNTTEIRYEETYSVEGVD